jgi:hypothetical protein
MPPKKKETTPKWGKSDNAKLLELIKQPGNGINLSCARSNIQAINKHWPHRTDWKQFSTLIRAKLQQFELESVIAGQRRAFACESCVVCFGIHNSQYTHLLFSSRTRI